MGEGYQRSVKAARATQGKVRSITLPPAMNADLVRRAEKNGVSVGDYIRGAIHEAMDRDMFAEMDAETICKTCDQDKEFCVCDAASSRP